MDGQRPRVIDGDGHIAEVENEINDFLDAPYGGRRSTFPLFPSLDGRVRRHGVEPTTPAVWSALIDRLGLEAAVVYPTLGLSLGLIQDPEWAALVARACNSWLAATYPQADARLKGLGEPSAILKPLEGQAPEAELVVAWRRDAASPLLEGFLAVAAEAAAAS